MVAVIELRRFVFVVLVISAQVSALAAGGKKGGFGGTKAKKSTAAGRKKGFTTSSATSIAPSPSQVQNPNAIKQNSASVVRRYPILNDAENPQFMGSFLIEDDSIIDGMMKLFDDAAPVRGVVSTQSSGLPVVDKSVKDSFETSVPVNDPRPAWKNYLRALKDCAGLYVQDYPYSAAYGTWSLISRTNIQRYPPSGGYKTFHTERTGAGEPEGSRHLVFMTYLNDVHDHGGTEFIHQNITIQPVKGLTLIWPADWTFTHRGVPSPTEEKTISTGWFNFLP